MSKFTSYHQAQTVLERSGKNLDEWMAAGSGRAWDIVRRPAAIDHETMAAERVEREAKANADLEAAIVDLLNQLPADVRRALPLPTVMA